MGRYKKGKRAFRTDMWTAAGGVEAVARQLQAAGILKRDQAYSSKLWSEVSVALFGINNTNNRHWLWTVWTYNRRCVRDQLHMAMRESKEMYSVPVTDTGQEADMPVSEPFRPVSNTVGQQSHRGCETEYLQPGDAAEDPYQATSKKHTDHSTDEIEKEGPDRGRAESETQGPEEGESENLTEGPDQRTSESDTDDADQDTAKSETEGTDQGTTVRENESTDQGPPESDLDPLSNIETHTPGTAVSETAMEPQEKKKKSNVWRKLPCMKEKFKITMEKRKWDKIVPPKGCTKLRQPWTLWLYGCFRQKNPCCTLAFKYQHVKAPDSRKINAPYVHIVAVCTFPSCRAKYVFTMKNKPVDENTKIQFCVSQRGEVRHKLTEKKFRPAAYLRRGRIARSIKWGPSHWYYRKLKSTPVPELLAGNITRPLNRNVLKVIASEVRKSTRLHNDVLMEMHLTQSILKECDHKFYKMPGYIQHYQVDPFGVHMYTETGISILVQHLRKKDPVTLYLDATGSVVSKIPNQAKRVLYYSLTLPGKGRDAPPVPVCEMLTNEHSVPPITFWLMKFTLQLSKYSQIRIQQVETDFSWALIQSVLLAFNKEQIMSYLDRAHAVCRGEKTWAEIRTFTVLHLCSAHILKAVTQAIGRQTKDKGLKDFATFAFARLQNVTSMDAARDIFRALCSVLVAEKETRTVRKHLGVLEQIISQIAFKDKSQEEDQDYTNLTRQDTEEEKGHAKTIMGRSPFTVEFQQVLEEVKAQVAKEKGEYKDNPYFCPGIIKILFDNYLGIFPLWSGLLLGNLKRYASDEKVVSTLKDSSKTRDTNCHVERWFGIVKQSILGKKKFLRPGAFIRKMYGSLQGRFMEHIVQNNLSQELLLKPLPPKDITQLQETWAKKKEANTTTTKSKFFSTPRSLPLPQRLKKKLQEKITFEKDTVTSHGQLLRDASKLDPYLHGSEVETLWKNDPTDLVVAIIRAPDKKNEYLLHHRDFQTLRPHEWLVGETIESYFRIILNSKNPAGRLFQLSHYTTGVVLYGTREQCARQSLKKVNFEAYDGVISFVNINNVHWKFVFLHALSKQIFVIDPQRGSDELEESRQAAYRFGQYFKMRHNQHGREDWVNIIWKPALIQHTFQTDGMSCGVFVMQMAKIVVEEFPSIPQFMDIEPTKTWMCHYRKQMALDIIQGSVSRDEYCSVCGLWDPPQMIENCVWIQCENCQRWFHLECLCIAVPSKHVQWFCVLCHKQS